MRKPGLGFFMIFFIFGSISLPAQEKMVELKHVHTLFLDFKDKNYGGVTESSYLVSLLPLNDGRQFLALIYKMKINLKDVDLNKLVIKKVEREHEFILFDAMGKIRLRQSMNDLKEEAFDRFNATLLMAGSEYDCSYIAQYGRLIICLRYDLTPLDQYEMPFKKVDGAALFHINGRKVLWVTGQFQKTVKHAHLDRSGMGIGIFDVEKRKWTYQPLDLDEIDHRLSGKNHPDDQNTHRTLMAAYPVQSLEQAGPPLLLLSVYLESQTEKEIRFFLVTFDDAGAPLGTRRMPFKIAIQPEAEQLELKPNQLILREKPPRPVYTKVYRDRDTIVMLREEQVPDPRVEQEKRVGSVMLQYGVVLHRNGESSKLLDIPRAFESFTMEAQNEPGVIRKGLRYPLLVYHGKLYFMCQYFKNRATGGAYRARGYGCVAIYQMAS